MTYQIGTAARERLLSVFTPVFGEGIGGNLLRDLGIVRVTPLADQAILKFRMLEMNGGTLNVMKRGENIPVTESGTKATGESVMFYNFGDSSDTKLGQITGKQSLVSLDPASQFTTAEALAFTDKSLSIKLDNTINKFASIGALGKATFYKSIRNQSDTKIPEEVIDLFHPLSIEADRNSIRVQSYDQMIYPSTTQQFFPELDLNTQAVPKPYWSDKENSNPLRDLIEWRDNFYGVGKPAQSMTVLIRRLAFRDLTENKQIIRNIISGVSNPTADRVSDADVVNYFAGFGITIILWDDNYLEATHGTTYDQMTYYLPQKDIVLLPNSYSYQMYGNAATQTSPIRNNKSSIPAIEIYTAPNPEFQSIQNPSVIRSAGIISGMYYMSGEVQEVQFNSPFSWRTSLALSMAVYVNPALKIKRCKIS